MSTDRELGKIVKVRPGTTQRIDTTGIGYVVIEAVGAPDVAPGARIGAFMRKFITLVIGIPLVLAGFTAIVAVTIMMVNFIVGSVR